MPRAFSEQEKLEIRESMKRAASELIGAMGFRKLSIDLIVEKTGIAKGSFYAFYKSKEDLVLDILDEIENVEQTKVYQAVSTATTLKDFLEILFSDMQTVFERHPELKRLSDENEASRLLMSLDHAARTRLVQKDLRFAQSCLQLARKKGFSPRFNELDLVLIGRSFFTLALSQENDSAVLGSNPAEVARAQAFVLKTIRAGIIAELTKGE